MLKYNPNDFSDYRPKNITDEIKYTGIFNISTNKRIGLVRNFPSNKEILKLIDQGETFVESSSFNNYPVYKNTNVDYLYSCSRERETDNDTYTITSYYETLEELKLYNKNNNNISICKIYNTIYDIPLNSYITKPREILWLEKYKLLNN
jgi:hypothetical protein